MEKRIQFGRVITLSDSAAKVKYMPFPTRRVLRWMLQFRSANEDRPLPVKILIAQEILVAVNNHVSQSVKTEMGGFLLGNRYWDPSTKGEFVIIDQYVEAEPTQATAVSFNFTDAAWMQVSEDLSGKFNGKALIGWYHSHPRLGVFLSESDLQVHKERFKEPWMVALVIDPVNQRGGFFGWLEDTIDSRHPVEFYEYLSGKMIETKQSGLPWVNYICYDEATKQMYKPLRLPLALPSAGTPPPHNPISSWFKMPLSWLKMTSFETPQYFALLAILVVVIFISAVLARRPVEDAEHKGDGSELNYKPPQPQPPPIDTTPIRTSNNEAAYLDNMGQRSIKRVNMHQPNKRRKQNLCDLQITFSPRVAPENCEVIVEWLKKNVPTGEMKDQPAKATYSCLPGGMNVTVTAHWPNLPQSQTIPVKFTVGNQTFHSNAGYGAVFLKTSPRDHGSTSTANTSGVASSAGTTTKPSTPSQPTADPGAPEQVNGAPLQNRDPIKNATELDRDGKPKKPPTEMERKNEGNLGRNGYGTATSSADRDTENYEAKKKRVSDEKSFIF